MEEKIIKMPPTTFLKVDEMVQRILGVLILLTLIVYPIAMLLLIPYGAWQVFSGVVGATYGSQWRIKYLGIVVAYFSTYYFADALDNRSGLIVIILMGIYCLTPLILGITYYVKTRTEMYAEAEGSPKWEDMNDILDIEMTNS